MSSHNDEHQTGRRQKSELPHPIFEPASGNANEKKRESIRGASEDRQLVARALAASLQIQESEKAEAERLRLERRVRRYLGQEYERFRRCTDQRPCDLAFCAMCTRIMQLKLVIEQTPTFRIGGSAPRWIPAVGMTLIPESGRIVPGQLVGFDLTKHRNWMRRLLHANSEAAFVLGGADISLNIHAEGEFPAHWQIHYHAIATNPDEFEDAAIRDALGEPGPTGGATLRVEKAYFPPRLIAYLSKFNVKQRISSAKTKRPAIKRLSAEHEAELVGFLRKYSVDKRFFQVRPQR